MTAADWSSVATSWESHAGDIEATSADATDALLAAAALEFNEDVLELGAGTGHLAVHLAALVGPQGTLLASDVAPAFVAVLEQRLADVPNANVATIDAAQMAVPDASYDVVVCRMGLMFVMEPTTALREIRRVLRPGGRLAAAVWGPPDGNPWMVSVGFATMMTGLLSGPLPTEAGGPFSLGDSDELEKLARDAGFAEVQVDIVSYVRRYARPINCSTWSACSLLPLPQHWRMPPRSSSPRPAQGPRTSTLSTGATTAPMRASLRTSPAGLLTSASCSGLAGTYRLVHPVWVPATEPP